MYPDSGADAATLGDLITACSRVIDYTRGLSRADLDRNHQLLSACCYQIAVIGEAVKRLSAASTRKFRGGTLQVCDRLIQGYDSVDIDELWKTSAEDIPALMEQVRKIRADLERQ
jgi:uncharacterized protein with HEPN domain